MTVLNGQLSRFLTILLYIMPARERERDEILISWVGYGDEYNTVELAKNVPNSAELVQDYWLTLPADCRLAAMAVTTYLPGI